MSTPPRFFENNSYYHIYNRANRKDQIFLEDRDYRRFLEKVIEYKYKFPIKILAYCIMPNHFHFLLQQTEENSISKFFSNLCNSQSKYYNIKYQTVGSLFQGRFKAKAVEKDEYLVHLSRYIHLNPISLFNRSGRNLFDQLLQYRWSSLAVYLSGVASELVDPLVILNYFSKKGSVEDYRQFVASNIQLAADPIVNHLRFTDD